jgi:hypothetical protein
LIWPTTIGQRFGVWLDLRQTVSTLPVDQALLVINSWWFLSPWKPYYLHWDDKKNWPTPWELLNDNWYCDLARGLGILYTISLIDRADLADARLVLTEKGDNLVLVAKEKYILNWNKDTIVNTNLDVTIKQQYTQQAVKQQYL